MPAFLCIVLALPDEKYGIYTEFPYYSVLYMQTPYYSVLSRALCAIRQQRLRIEVD